MKNVPRILLAVLGLMGLFIAIGLAPGLAGPETKSADTTAWEYQVLSLPDGNVFGIHEKWIPELNKAGGEGWEVVSTVPLMRQGDSSGLRVLLKRVKNSSEAIRKSKPAAPNSEGVEEENGARAQAERNFNLLDMDGNGEISEIEFKRSILVQKKFKEFGINLTFPVARDEFLKVYPTPAAK